MSELPPHESSIAGIPPAANDNSISQTIALWRPRLGRDLSREDARQMVENVTGFFSILYEWSRAETRIAANDNRKDPAVGDTEEVRRDR